MENVIFIIFETENDFSAQKEIENVKSKTFAIYSKLRKLFLYFLETLMSKVICINKFFK